MYLKNGIVSVSRADCDELDVACINHHDVPKLFIKQSLIACFSDLIPA
jgi:hypothetical protein